MQEHLVHRHGGYFAFGKLHRPNLGPDARARISGRLWLEDLEAYAKSSPNRMASANKESLVSVCSETGSISSRSLTSSFYRMASASRESLDSSLSMIFAPSSETGNVNIHQLALYLQSKHRLSKTVILGMATYHSSSIIKHMFVVLRLKQGHREGWLRLERRAEDPSSISFLFSGMRGPTKDEVCHILFS